MNEGKRQSTSWWTNSKSRHAPYETGRAAVVLWPARPQFRAGYTLIEALIAITMIVFATTGPLVLAGKSLGESYYARDQIVAYYLAQEGIELVRAVRDGDPAGWLTTLVQCTGSNTCDLDATKIDSFRIIPCSSSDSGITNATVKCNLLHQYPTGSGTTLTNGVVYAPSDPTARPGVTGVISKFTRNITIRLVTGTEQKISVSVFWKNGLITRNVKVEEDIF